MYALSPGGGLVKSAGSVSHRWRKLARFEDPRSDLLRESNVLFQGVAGTIEIESVNVDNCFHKAPIKSRDRTWCSLAPSFQRTWGGYT